MGRKVRIRCSLKVFAHGKQGEIVIALPTCQRVPAGHLKAFRRTEKAEDLSGFQ